MIRSMSLPGGQIRRRDVVLAVIFSAYGLALMYSDVTSQTPNASDLAIPFFLAVTIPVLWRSSAPLAALALVLVALSIHVVLFGTITRCGVVFPLVWVLVFAAGARLSVRPALIGLVLGLCAIVVMASADHQVKPSDAIPFEVLTVILWGIARLVRSRTRIASQLRARTEELRQVRDQRARLEIATDRARLSGELEELLHRRIGDLAQLADEGTRAGDAASATAALAGIEHDSRQTLEEMRTLVGVLRDDGQNGGPIAPQPTLTSLDALVVQSKGTAARLTVDGIPRALPAGVELSAYRIVEHLLGALDDAPGVEVRISFTDNALEVAISGPASRRREIGAAIDRARERAQLHHGKLHATVRGGQAQATAELPLMATVGA